MPESRLIRNVSVILASIAARLRPPETLRAAALDADIEATVNAPAQPAFRLVIPSNFAPDGAWVGDPLPLERALRSASDHVRLWLPPLTDADGRGRFGEERP